MLHVFSHVGSQDGGEGFYLLLLLVLPAHLVVVQQKKDLKLPCPSNIPKYSLIRCSKVSLELDNKVECDN